MVPGPRWRARDRRRRRRWRRHRATGSGVASRARRLRKKRVPGATLTSARPRRIPYHGPGPRAPRSRVRRRRDEAHPDHHRGSPRSSPVTACSTDFVMTSNRDHAIGNNIPGGGYSKLMSLRCAWNVHAPVARQDPRDSAVKIVQTLPRPQISDGASTQCFPSGPRRPGRREGHYAPSAGGASGDDATGCLAGRMQPHGIMRATSRHNYDVKTH